MNALHDRIAKARVVVCVGTGGVGKTTASAVIALHAAVTGRKALVLTIDPARRLANSLGLDTIGDTESPIDFAEPLGLPDDPAGELWAQQLNMKHAFDAVVRRNTDSERTAQRILDNKYYQYFSSSLAGTQEYSAVEQLYEISNQGRYDLIVLDTPPTQHALDFLEAPDRLYQALASSALQWLFRPALASGKVTLGLFKRGAKSIRKVLGRITGSELLDELTVFLESLSPLLDGFKERAAKVRDILHDPSTLFLVVTTPDPLAVQDAADFDERLGSEGVQFAGFVANRVHQPTVRQDETVPSTHELTEVLIEIPGAGYIGRRTIARLAKEMLRNAEDFAQLSRQDARMLEKLSREAKAPVFPVPFYSRDIHTLEGLERVRRDLFDDE